MPVTLSCPQCGQALSVSAAPGQQVRCGSCNAVFPMPQAAAQMPPGQETTLDYATPSGPLRTGMAVAALVLGILGLVLCPPIFGILGLVLGIVALVRASNRPAEYGGRGMAIGGICCGAAGLLLVIPLQLAILLPSLSRARELAKRAVCSANLRGIGQSCHIYANDNEEWFPPDLQTLIDAGHLTPAELQCPSEPNSSQAVFDYIYVPGLDTRAPVDWIIVYEDPANHGGEGGNVLYIDSHVEFLEEPEFSAELERVRREIEESEYGEHPWYRAHPLKVP
jgi:prepilin-type processing-associated H-X9-DG protein